MTFKLFGKIYSDGPVASFHSFKAAVIEGQERFGKKNFHVESPESYAPSREEQLLQDIDASRRKRSETEFESVQHRKARKEIAALRERLLTCKDWDY